MIPFAVSIEGVHKEGQATWVLAIEGDRILVSYEDRTFHWHPMSECRFAKIMNPEAPQPVILVQPANPPLVNVHPSRQLLRKIERNGA